MEHVSKVGVENTNTTRTTISVPKRVKKLMDKVNDLLAENDEKINWSAVASEAFEKAALEIFEQRGEPKPKKKKKVVPD